MNRINNKSSTIMKQEKNFKNNKKKINNSFMLLKEGFDTSVPYILNTDNISNTSNTSNTLSTTNTLTTTNTSDINDLDMLENQFNSLLSKYQTLKQSTQQSIENNIELYNTNNPYKNQNVKFSNNVLGYVTNNNVFKKYTDGIQTVPGVVVLISTPFPNLTTGQTINTTPPLIVGTPMKIGGNQSVGNEGINVLVTKNTNIPDTYLGCYNDSSSRAMTAQDNGSQTFNYQSCKTRAMDVGAQIFGLQYVDPTTGLSQCFTSNNLQETTQYGLNLIYTTSTIWSISSSNQIANSYFLLQKNGDIYFYDQENNLLTGSLSTSKYGVSMNQKYLSTCLNGGNISNVNATYGLNCSIKGTPSKQIYTPPNYPNVVYNNVGPIITSAIGNDTRKYTYQIGVDNSGVFQDPAPGCYKNFDLNYMCGQNLVQIPTIYGKNPGTDRKMVVLDCTKFTPSCKSFLILQDNGNLSIYGGNDPNNFSLVIYSYKTNTSLKVPNPNYVASKGKTGVNYIMSGYGLMSGEWIGSNDGSMCLMMDSSGVLNLIITTKVTNNCSVSSSDGKKTGGSWTNAVYQMSSVPQPNLLNKIGYIDNNSKLNEYPTTMITKSNNYLKYDQYDSSPYDITNYTSSSLTDCREKCNSNLDCNAFVLDNNNTCYLKNDDAFPNGLRQVDPNKTLYVRKPIVQKEYLNTYTPYYGKDSVGFDSEMTTGSTNEICENTCNSSSSCAGYVYDSGNCWIKYKVPTSNISTSTNETSVVYVRNVTVPPFNLTDYVDIDTDKWNKYDNSGIEMSYTTNTNISNNLISQEQQTQLNDMEVQLYLLATQLSNKIKYLESQNISTNNSLKTSIDDFTKNVEQIKEIKTKTNMFKNSNVTNSMLSDTDIRVLQSNYSYIGITILAIIIVIITMNKIKN